MANDRILHKNLGGTFSKKTLKKFSNHADGTKSIFKFIRLMVLWNHSEFNHYKKALIIFLFIEQQNSTINTAQ